MKLAILTLLLSTATSFTNPQPRVATRTNPLRMSDYDDSYPSDSSEDAHFSVAASDEKSTIDVDNKPSSAAEATVSSLMDYLPSSITSGPISSEDKASINEAILKLEALNPTEDPVYSPMLNGVWILRYAPRDLSNFSLGAVSGGYSPGLLALGLAQKLPVALVELGELEISISRAQPRIEAKIDVKLLGGSTEEILVKARLDVDSGIRFTETYESASVLGQTVDIPEALQYSRDLYVSYVDEDVLVVRDGSGVPEILVRK
ncbi:hypothetical protein ACHAWO_001721 [Cyclotella atomus]|uniref:Plastid lipid-associated protein/fibrillin conserved domain-containing protein n=1 Tax=Cyclotella atomus TaxID=382360 RepID=A0ABD3NFJ5_9STRA